MEQSDDINSRSKLANLKQRCQRRNAVRNKLIIELSLWKEGEETQNYSERDALAYDCLSL